MTTTLLRRVERLEIVIPPPPLPPSDSPEWEMERWWSAAPAAVRHYIGTIDAEVGAAGFLPPYDAIKGAAALAWEQAHHPHMRGVYRLIERHAAAGASAALGEVQHAILSGSFARLHAHYREHLPSGGVPHTWIEATWRNGFGRSNLHGYHHADTDKGGSSWVQIWRASGTTAPEVRALMGFGAAELALLAADE